MTLEMFNWIHVRVLAHRLNNRIQVFTVMSLSKDDQEKGTTRPD